MKEEIEKAIGFLKEGKTILCPSDTLWGISCDATNYEAVKKIFSIKKREESKSLIVLVSSIEMLETLTETTVPNILSLISSFQKPVSIVFPNAKNLAKNTIAKDGSIAIRLVKEGFCKELITAFGKPMVSSSANFSGEKSPLSFSEIEQKFKEKIDFIVPNKYENTNNTSSTIIKIVNSEIIILRG